MNTTFELDEEKILETAISKARDLIESKPLQAEVILKQTIKCRPDHKDGLQLLGLLEHRLNKHPEAVEILQVAIDVDPGCAENHNNIGLAYACMMEHDKAVEHSETAVRMKPNEFIFRNNLALHYRQIGDYEGSIEQFQKALELQNVPQVWNNLGGVYGELKDLDKAEECFLAALELDPDYAPSHVDMAFINHLRGNWQKGFEEYEWRFNHFPQLKFYEKAYDQAKKWDGTQSLEGKTILLYGEQGLGDTIQFIRYVPLIKEKGCKVVLHVPPPLQSIISRCEGVDGTMVRDIVTGMGDDYPDYDYQCSLISLPHLLQTYEMQNKVYITPLASFNSKEQYPDTFNIGITWAGSPAHPNDITRSLKLKYFKPIHDMPNVKLFNLQVDMRKRMYNYGPTNVDLTEGCDDMRIVDMTNMIQSFEDTATIIDDLDLIICCDTALVHLAGAMGIPCWALIPYNPDWRWGLEGDTTHWYDSVRLIRQQKRGDWEGVMEDVKSRLNHNLAFYFSWPETT